MSSLPLSADPALLALAEQLEAGELWMLGHKLRRGHLSGTSEQRQAHLAELVEKGWIEAEGDSYRLTLRGALSCQQYAEVYESRLGRLLEMLKAHEIANPGFDAISWTEIARHDNYLKTARQPKALFHLLLLARLLPPGAYYTDESASWPLDTAILERVLTDATSVAELVRILAPPVSSRPGLDIAELAKQDEGQYLERKSLWEGNPAAKKPRDRKTVRDEIAYHVAAFANADGGMLMLGIEDDGTTTGHSYPQEEIQKFLRVPAQRLKPALEPGQIADQGAHQVVIFDIRPAPTSVMVIGNGFPRRVGDGVIQEEQAKIDAWKQAGIASSWETRPSSVEPNQLDRVSLARAVQAAGLGNDWQRFLLDYRLADESARGLVLKQASVLLFAERPSIIEHANAGVRVFRVVGTTRRSGAQANVEERPRIEGNLPTVLGLAMQEIEGLLRKPARLSGLTFQTESEIPRQAWQEAIVNAVAHRDYAQLGRAVEVWLYDDRMEIRNPGGVLEGISLAELQQGKRVHASRNPRVTRVLALLGFMREQGEGIPRMFGEMSERKLPQPELEVAAGEFIVTLKGHPTDEGSGTNGGKQEVET